MQEMKDNISKQMGTLRKTQNEILEITGSVTNEECLLWAHEKIEHGQENLCA